MDHLVRRLAEVGADRAAAATLCRDAFVFTMMRHCRLCICEVLTLKMGHFRVSSGVELTALCHRLEHGDAIRVRPHVYPRGFVMSRIGGPTCPVEWLTLLMSHDRDRTGGPVRDRIVRSTGGQPPVREVLRSLKHYLWDMGQS